MDIRQRVFGPRHPETLRTSSVLTTDVFMQGRFAEAERLKAQRGVWSEHSDTLHSMVDLGNILDAEAKYPETGRSSSRPSMFSVGLSVPIIEIRCSQCSV
jgi:hypothetical protein